MAFQMWRTGPDGQERKKILQYSEKSISGKNFLQKAWRQQYTSATPQWEPQLFQIKELPSKVDNLHAFI